MIVRPRSCLHDPLNQPHLSRTKSLGDTLVDHDGDTLGDDIRLVSPDMKAPVATSLAMGAGS
jgi:hypothetical protein